MKKLLLGAILGIATGAVGYKLYKENEEEVKNFLDEHLLEDDEIDVDDIDLEDLEELRDCIDEMIDAKLEEDYTYDDDYDFDGELLDEDEASEEDD